MSKEQHIHQSWDANAAAWTNMVRNERSESRRLVTDAAIVGAVVHSGGGRVLDAGCGEGWLARQLTASACDVTGFDGSADLIAAAREEGGGKFVHCTYEQFIADPTIPGVDFDVVAFNFALLGETITDLLRAARSAARDSGRLIIQTVHPFSVADGKYEDGWREERFEGLSGEWSAMPWYFRTVGSWFSDVRAAGWQLSEVIEPVHPRTHMPASLIIIATAARAPA